MPLPPIALQLRSIKNYYFYFQPYLLPWSSSHHSSLKLWFFYYSFFYNCSIFQSLFLIFPTITVFFVITGYIMDDECMQCGREVRITGILLKNLKHAINISNKIIVISGKSFQKVLFLVTFIYPRAIWKKIKCLICCSPVPHVLSP